MTQPRSHPHPPLRQLERLSIELHDRCGKACWFCYNGSNPAGEGSWNPDDVIALVDGLRPPRRPSRLLRRR